MPDPAEIIAETILRPPPQGGWHDENFAWQYTTTMGNQAAPDYARHIAGSAIKALAASGWRIVPSTCPDPATLPSAEQIRRWMTAHDWELGGPPGPAGDVWVPPTGGRAVGVPEDDSDPELVAGAVQRAAQRMGMPLDQVTAEIRSE